MPQKKTVPKKQNLFLLTGENTYDLRNFYKKWFSSAVTKYGEYSVQRHDMEDNCFLEVNTEISSFSFFSEEKRVFFLENFPPSPPSRPLSAEKKEEIASLTENILSSEEDMVIVLVSPKPDKRSAAYKKLFPACAKVSTFPAWKTDFSGLLSSQGLQEAALWVEKQSQGKITGKTASFLVEFCGNNSWKIATEIQKILLYSEKKNIPITPSLIESLCIPHDDMANFALSNSFASGKAHAVLETVEQLLHTGVAPQTIILRDLAPIFRQYLQAKIAMEEGLSAKDIGLHPFVLSKIQSRAKTLSRKTLHHALCSLLKIDIDSKTGKLPISHNGSGEFLLQVEQIILRFFGSISEEERGKTTQGPSQE